MTKKYEWSRQKIHGMKIHCSLFIAYISSIYKRHKSALLLPSKLWVPHRPRSATMLSRLGTVQPSDPKAPWGLVTLMGREGVSRVYWWPQTDHLSLETSVTLWRSGLSVKLQAARRYQETFWSTQPSYTLAFLTEREIPHLGWGKCPDPFPNHGQALFSSFPSFLCHITFCHHLPSPCVFWPFLGPVPVIWNPPQLLTRLVYKSKNLTSSHIEM